MDGKTTILIKTDKRIKKSAQKAAGEIGVPLATILNAYLRQFAREGRISFEAPLTPNAKTRKMIAESRREFRKSKSQGPFKTVNELFESLDK